MKADDPTNAVASSKMCQWILGTVQRTKPRTPHAERACQQEPKTTEGGLTDVHYPAGADRGDGTAIPEALDPQTEGETSPSANKVLCTFPEEYTKGATHDTRYRACKDKHALQRVIWRVYGRKNTELCNENETNKRKGIKSNKKEGCPGGRRVSLAQGRVKRTRGYHLFLWPQKALGKPVRMRRAPRTLKAGVILVSRTIGAGVGVDVEEDVAVGENVLVVL